MLENKTIKKFNLQKKAIVLAKKEKTKRANELIIANIAKDKAVINLKKLKNKLEYYKQVVIDANDAVIIQDFNGVIKAWNKGAEMIYGFKEKEMLGKNITKIIAKEHQAQARKNIKAIKQGKPSFRVKQTRLTKDKKKVFVNITYSPIYEYEEIIEIGTTEEDISKIKESEEKFRNLILGLPITEYILVHKHGNLLWVSDSIVSFLNIPKKKILGTSIYGYVEKEYQKIVHKNLSKRMEGKSINDYDIKVINKKGQIMDVRVRGSLINYEGSRANLLVLSDITDYKISGGKLIESEYRFRNIFEFSSIGVSIISIDGHWLDVNNALCKIVGYSKRELLNDKFNDITYPDDINIGLGAIKKILSGKINHANFKKRYVNKMGNIIWVNISTAVVRNSVGKPLYFVSHTEDITREKIAEEELQKLSFIIENTLEGHALFNVGKGRRLTYVNKAWERITGYKSNEVVNKKEPFMFSSIKNNPEQKRRLMRAIQSNQIFQEEMIWTTKSGKKIFVDVLSMPLKNNNDSVQWFNTIRDVTEKKISQEKIIENERLLEESQRIAQIGSYKMDFIKGFWVSSERLDNIFGIDDKYNRSIEGWLEIIRLDDRDMMNEYLKDYVIAGHHKFEKEYRIVRISDKQIRWVRGLGEVKFDKNGNITEMVGTIQDITEQKNTDEKRREGEEKFRRLFEAAKDSILILDFETGQITDSNPFVEKMLGFTKEELLGKAIFEISPFKDIVKNKEKLEELKNKGYVYYSNLPLETKFGKKIYAEFVSNVYLVGNKKVIQCNIRDVTERMILDEAKDSFLSLASHQLRTPLAATKWVLESLIGEKESFTQKQQTKFNDLITSNERIIKLVNYLLNVTRIESGKLVVNKKEVDIRVLFADVSTRTDILKVKKNIEIIIPPDITSVYTDPVLISEVLDNLVTNAVYYSEKSSSKITIKIEDRSDDYLVSVHNEGYIDTKTQEKIKKFEKFTRGDDATKIQPSGSGLGLYITKKIVQMNGGIIWFESKAKTGTTFYFTINKK